MIDKVNDLEKILTSKEILDFIAGKCMKELEKICSEKLNATEDTLNESVYRKANQYEIDKSTHTIKIFNDSVINVSEKNWMSEERKSKYPDYEISLAKIIEYGVGYAGSVSSKSEVENWQYDVNGHGSQGWKYKDKNDNWKSTNGFSGRYIYLTLRNRVEEKASDWIYEYIGKKMKD